MTYKVNLTLVSGQQPQRTEIGHGPTPKVGSIIDVGYGLGLARAKVTAVRPGKDVDEVDAQEM